MDKPQTTTNAPFVDKDKPSQSPKPKRTAEQNAQARLVLIQLLWLLMALIIAGLVWLANNQHKLSLYVEERLKITETFGSRMNDMDDRLFAMANKEQASTSEHNGKTDLQLTSIQLAAANRIYQDGDYQGADEILTAIEWQLNNDELVLAVPIKSALKNAIKDDKSAIKVLQTQTDPWQADGIKLREIQSYLRTLKGNNFDEKLALHDATMLINLTLGAVAMRERETMVVYLNEILAKLTQLKQLKPSDDGGDNGDIKNNLDNNVTTTSEYKTVDSLDRAIFAVNELLANPPTLAPLQSFELLNKK